MIIWHLKDDEKCRDFTRLPLPSSHPAHAWAGKILLLYGFNLEVFYP